MFRHWIIILCAGFFCTGCSSRLPKPNILFVFADQLRSQELSCYGGVNIQTPNLDRLASEGLRMTNAFSTYPICSPYRGMLLTGLYPLHSGISNNDHPLNPELESIGTACKQAGYQTAYIGKWHLDGMGRTVYIPPERRLGFDYWMALECTHNYFNSDYYDTHSTEQKRWEGYDADSQTDAAIDYIRNREKEQPFLMMISWGPPHDPYIAPEEYHREVDQEKLVLRPNVSDASIADDLWNNPRFNIPEKYRERSEPRRLRARDEQAVRNNYAGYLAATLALDDYFGRLLDALENEGILDNTIVVFSSDHGDHVGSHQIHGKCTPFLESTSIPFLLRYPKSIKPGMVCDALMTPMDVLPTLLGLSDVAYPEVDGEDLSGVFTQESEDTRDEILLMNLTHFNNAALINGLDTWRGVQTRRYTYARESNRKPWLLYDNIEDPYQLRNLVDDPAHQDLLKTLDAKLDSLLLLASDPEDNRVIYDRIIKENPKRQLVHDFREANPDKNL